MSKLAIGKLSNFGKKLKALQIGVDFLLYFEKNVRDHDRRHLRLTISIKVSNFGTNFKIERPIPQ